MHEAEFDRFILYALITVGAFAVCQNREGNKNKRWGGGGGHFASAR